MPGPIMPMGIAAAPQTFSADPDSANLELLISPLAGDTAFADVSSNAWSLTETGSPTLIDSLAPNDNDQGMTLTSSQYFDCDTFGNWKTKLNAAHTIQALILTPATWSGTADDFSTVFTDGATQWLNLGFNGGQLYLEAWSGAITDPVVAPNNTLLHVAYTMDGSRNGRLFKNGKQVGSTATRGNITTTPTVAGRVGSTRVDNNLHIVEYAFHTSQLWSADFTPPQFRMAR